MFVFSLFFVAKVFEIVDRNTTKSVPFAASALGEDGVEVGEG